MTQTISTLRAKWYRVNRRNGVALVLLAIVAVFAPNLTTANAEPTLISGGGSSCVAEMSGWSHVSNFTWTNGESRIVKYKCYYGGTFYAGYGGYMATSSTASTGANCIYWRADGSTFEVVTSTGTTGFVWSAWTTPITATGYVEGQFTITRHSGISKTMSASSSFEFDFDPNCTNSGTDRLKQGSSSTAVSRFVASGAAFTSAEPTYRWGPTYSLVSPFCGAEVTATGLTADSILSQGQVIDFVTAWTSGTTRSVDVLLPAQRWRRIYTAGTIGNPAHMNVTNNVPPERLGPILRMSMVKLRCVDDISEVEYFLDFGDLVTDIGDGRPRPCMVPQFYWPRIYDVTAGESVGFDLSYSGLVTTGLAFSTITVEYTTWNESGTIPAGSTWPALTWATLVAAAPLGTSATYNATAGYAGTPAQFIFRCTDALGTIYATGPWSASMRLRAASGTGADAEEDCYSGSGLGLNPSSWVPGLGRMTACIMRQMFIPSDEMLSALMDSGQSFSERAPFAYGVRGYGIADETFDGAGTSITSHSADCLSIIDITPTGQDLGSDTVCPMESVASGDLSAVRVILGYAAWLAFGWMIFLLTRKVVTR